MAKHRYSGERSHQFWKRISKLRPRDRAVLYALGADLQAQEARVLARLENAERRRKARA